MIDQSFDDKTVPCIANVFSLKVEKKILRQICLTSASSSIFSFSKQGCFICKHKGFWRCVRCIVAAHKKCAPWPDNFVPIKNQPRRAVCWRHPADWLLEKEVDFFFPSLDSDVLYSSIFEISQIWTAVEASVLLANYLQHL